ncbi:Ribokinase [Roseibacterium elongatum DSM 19469]|uniref:Ribokinase n=1 Tax=Roseicyclus elongatus DSM 19469 TaxID=1294273 RepID=W8SPW7_9RHOB|nr:ribokinase [Roseibacterium elongatum]AHM04575.1 Ribokinase [Roseibacterium elongatum DSM 19469]
MSHDIVILGVFVADTAYRAARLPRMGETLIGSGFALGPGGKGSNQAVAAARAGGTVGYLTRLGDDDFGAMAREIWAEAGVTSLATVDPEGFTGAAFVFVDEATGQNAIIISPGVGGEISAADVVARADLIRGAKVVMTQLEQPLDAAEAMLRTGRTGGAITILNPAPAADVPDALLGLCDYVTPNETEAEGLTGLEVTDLASAEAAARALLDRGVAKAAILTLGEKGALWVDHAREFHTRPMDAGPVVDTTGAGDAFNGGLATALAEGRGPEEAMRFATATAALSVTRHGTARAMPTRPEIERLLTGA